MSYFEKLDAADRKKYLGTKAEDPQKLCGCIPKTKAIKPIHNEITNNETEHFSGVIVLSIISDIVSLCNLEDLSPFPSKFLLLF